MAYQLIKTSGLSKPYVWIDYCDPAFDLPGNGFVDDEGDPSAEGWRAGLHKFRLALEEALEGNHMDRVKGWLKPGEEPTFWTLRHLTDDDRRYVTDEHIKKTGETISFQVLKEVAGLALCGVRNLAKENGQPFEFTQTARHPVIKSKCAPKDVLDKLSAIDEGGVLTRIGLHALNRTRPSGN